MKFNGSFDEKINFQIDSGFFFKQELTSTKFSFEGYDATNEMSEIITKIHNFIIFSGKKVFFE